MYENTQLTRAIEKTQNITKWSQNTRKQRLVLKRTCQHFKERDAVLNREAVMGQKSNDTTFEYNRERFFNLIFGTFSTEK